MRSTNTRRGDPGGSPADFMVYDVFPGACSPDNINRTQSHGDNGYFCPIWDQVQGQCLTMERWAQINAFALQAVSTGTRLIAYSTIAR